MSQRPPPAAGATGAPGSENIIPPLFNLRISDEKDAADAPTSVHSSHDPISVGSSPMPIRKLATAPEPGTAKSARRLSSLSESSTPRTHRSSPFSEVALGVAFDAAASIAGDDFVMVASNSTTPVRPDRPSNTDHWLPPVTPSSTGPFVGDGDPDNVSGRAYNPKSTWEYLMARGFKPFNHQSIIDRCKPWRLAWFGRRREPSGGEAVAQQHGRDKLRMPRWYSKPNDRTGAWKNLPAFRKRPDLERRFVWRWTVANPGAEESQHVWEQQPVAGLILPYSQEEEGVRLDSSDHVEQPEVCYQYRLKQQWLDTVIVSGSDIQETAYVRGALPNSTQGQANHLIEEQLKDGRRLPQTNNELTLWHKTTKIPTDAQDSNEPAPTANSTGTNRAVMIRRLVYERPKGLAQRVLGRGTINVGGQGLKYLYPFYEYKELRTDFATSREGQRENPREGERAVPVMLVDVNAHAPLIFKEQGGLKPKYMQDVKRKVQYKTLKEGIRADVHDEKMSTQGRDMLQLIKDQKARHPNEFTADELRDDPNLLGEYPQTLDDIKDNISRLPNFQNVSDLARGRVTKTGEYRNAPSPEAKNAIIRRERIRAMLNSNLDMPQNLCAIVRSPGNNTKLDIGTHPDYKDATNMMTWAGLLGESQHLKEIVYAPAAAAAAAASAESVQQYPYPPQEEPETKSAEIDFDKVKVVFFPTLPSATSQADLTFHPMLECERMYGYEIDGMNRDVDNNLKPRIPSIWKMAMLHNTAATGEGANPLSTGISDKMFTADFKARVQQYKAAKAEYDRDFAEWFQNQQDFQTQAADRETRMARWNDYYAWYISLEDAMNQSAVMTNNGEPVKRIPLVWSEDKSEKRFNGVDFPHKTLNNSTRQPFSRQDYRDAGFVQEIDSAADWWYQRPARNDAEKAALESIYERPDAIEDWDFFVKDDAITPDELNALWPSFATGVVDYGHVYAFAPPQKPATIQLEEEPEEPEIPTLPTQHFKTGVAGGTDLYCNGINSSILDDATFMHVVQHLTMPHLTGAVPGVFKHPHVQKTQEPGANPPTHTATHNAAYIIPYALYDKDEFNALMLQNPLYQKKAQERAEQDAMKEAERARKQEEEQAKRDEAAKKAKEDEEAQAAAEEARRKLEATVQPVLDAVNTWRTANGRPVNQYLPSNIITTVDHNGIPIVREALDLTIEEWCRAWINCKTDVNPFDYMLTLNGKYVFNQNTYQTNDMDGLNRQDGIRFESDTEYALRLRQWQNQPDDLLKLPWRPERHEPSFKLLVGLAGKDTGVLPGAGVLIAGARPSETKVKYDQRFNTWRALLTEAKDLYTGRLANCMHEENAASQASYQNEEQSERARAMQEMRERRAREERVREQLEREQLERERAQRAPARRPPGQPPRPRQPRADPGPSDPGPSTLNLPPLRPVQPEQPEQPLPPPDLPMPAAGQDSGSDSDSDEDDFMKAFAPADPAADPPKDEDMLEQDSMQDLFDRRRAQNRTRSSLLKHAEKLDRLYVALVGDVANRRTPEDTLDEMSALVGQASDESFSQMVMRCDITDQWMLHKLRARE